MQKIRLSPAALAIFVFFVVGAVPGAKATEIGPIELRKGTVGELYIASLEDELETYFEGLGLPYTRPHKWEENATGLPSWLELSSEGALHGRPTVAGVTNFTGIAFWVLGKPVRVTFILSIEMLQANQLNTKTIKVEPEGESVAEVAGGSAPLATTSAQPLHASRLTDDASGGSMSSTTSGGSGGERSGSGSARSAPPSPQPSTAQPSDTGSASSDADATRERESAEPEPREEAADAPPPDGSTKPATPTLKEAPLDGERTLSGYADGGAIVYVEVIAGDYKPATRRVRLADDAEEWTVEFERPLATGQQIKVWQVNAEGKKSDQKEHPVKSVEYNWGRVRGYFSAGEILSKERGEFSQPDIFVGFHLDKNWYWGRDPARNPALNLGLNTYFDARLTSLPATAMEDEEGDQQQQQQQQPATEGQFLDSFVTSEKAALMQIGVYLPIYLKSTTWNFQGHKNSIFVAPIGKFGLQTITDRDGLAEEGATLVSDDDFFNFYSGGLRFGHYRLHDTPSVAPELISYLDVTYGKWENFELARVVGQRDVLDDMGMVIGTEPITVRERPGRFGFEGRLKIPRIPFLIGFDGNAGDGPDDLRFLFGTVFDVGKVIGALGGRTAGR